MLSDNVPTNPVSQRLYDAILALDKFVASFQDRLHRIDDAKNKCDVAFDDEKNRVKRQHDTAVEDEHIRFNHEKNNIDGHLRNAQVAIDNDLAKKHRQLAKAIIDIDNDVELHCNQVITRIDNELREKKTQLTSRIDPLDSKISEIKRRQWSETYDFKQYWKIGRAHV